MSSRAVADSGKQTEVTIDVPAGAIRLSMAVTPTPGAEVAGAMLYLFRGTVAFDSYAEVFSVPLAWSPKDQEQMQRVSRNVASVKACCTPVHVVAAPEEQTVTVEVPAMAPLP